MEINLAQATAHFMNKVQGLSAEEADLFMAVRNHWRQEAQKVADEQPVEEGEAEEVKDEDAA